MHNKHYHIFFFSICAATNLFGNIPLKNNIFEKPLQNRNVNSIIVNNANLKINTNKEGCILNTNAIKTTKNSNIKCNEDLNVETSGELGQSIPNIPYKFEIPIIHVDLSNNLKKQNLNIEGKNVYVYNKIPQRNINTLNISNSTVHSINIQAFFHFINFLNISSSTNIESYPSKSNSNLTIGNIGNIRVWNIHNNISFLHYNNISIKNIHLKADFKLMLNAKNNITIEKLILGKGNTFIESPLVYIKHLQTTNLGENNIVIKADKVFIDSIDLKNLSKLTFKSIDNKPIKVYIKNLKLSSLSSVLLSTGEYHIKNILLPQTNTTHPLFASINNKQKIQIFLDNNLSLNYDYIINTFETNSKAIPNMYWFINGDLLLKGSHENLNAYFYVEKNIVVNSKTNLNGAFSAKGNIIVNNDLEINDFNISNVKANQNNQKIKTKPQPRFNFVKNNIETKIAGNKYLIPITIKNYNGIAFVKNLNQTEYINNHKSNDVNLKDYLIVKFHNGKAYFPLNANYTSREQRLIIILPNFQNFAVKEYLKQLKKIKKDEVTSSISNDKKDINISFEQISKFNKNSFEELIKILKQNHISQNQIFNKNETFYSDTFAIRPAKFVFTPIKKNIKAGELIKLKITALDSHNKPIKIKDYSIGPYKQDNALLKYNIADKATVRGELSYKDTKFNLSFSDIINVKYNEVGKINLLLQEHIGNEFAKIDAKDTPIKNRLINSNLITLSYIPYGFNVYFSHEPANTQHNFTYLGTYNYKQMNKLILNIQAVDKDGLIVQNYDKNSDSQNGTLVFNIHSNQPLFTDLLSLYNTKLTTLKTNPNDTQKDWTIIEDINKNMFKKGSAVIKVGYSFKKDIQNPIAPFYTSINKITYWDKNKINILNISPTFNSFEKVKNIYGKIDYSNAKTTNNNIDLMLKYMYWNNGEWLLNKYHSINNGDINLKETRTKNPDFIVKEIQPPLNGIELLRVKLKDNVRKNIKKINFNLVFPNYFWIDLNNQININNHYIEIDFSKN